MSGDFETIVGLIADGLNASGFSLARGEAQQWTAQFTLERANIDGTVTLLFGPLVHVSDLVVALPYQIVHKNTYSGEIRMSAESPRSSMARRFLTRFAAIMDNSLLAGGYSDPHVGAGLIDVTEADSTLKTSGQSLRGD